MPRKKSGVSKSRKSYFKKYYKQNIKAYALRSLQNYYGLTPTQAEIILKLRKSGRCYICNKKPSGSKRGPNSVLHVDHDHSTGKIRGLVCNHCNRALGAFYDDPSLMAKATKYLKNPPGLEHYIPNTRKSKRANSVLLVIFMKYLIDISIFMQSFGF